jgi:hypothetical protein
MDGRILSFDRSARLCGGELAIRRCVAAVAFAPIADLPALASERGSSTFLGHSASNPGIGSS